jgi:hypothetical protein
MPDWLQLVWAQPLLEHMNMDGVKNSAKMQRTLQRTVLLTQQLLLPLHMSSSRTAHV